MDKTDMEYRRLFLKKIHTISVSILQNVLSLQRSMGLNELFVRTVNSYFICHDYETKYRDSIKPKM